MGESEMTLPEMLNTIEDGAREVKEAWEKEDKKAAWKAYSEDMKDIDSIEPWNPSRYSTKVKNLMEEISHSITDELYGLMYNEDDMQKLKNKLSNIIQAVCKCRSAFSNANNQKSQKH